MTVTLNRPLIHPTHRSLDEFALGALPPRSISRLQRHLAGCSRCRAEIQKTRAASTVVASVQGTSTLRADALERVLAARERGQRVVLPVDGPRAGTHRRLSVSAVAAGLLLAGVGALVYSTRPSRLSAAELSGDLNFSPATPAAGAHIVATYHPAADLAKDHALVLRVRYRMPWDELYQLWTRQAVATRLVRNRSGDFVGSFDLPPQAVFGAFAVENASANRVDANDGHLWRLLVYRGATPTFASLMQQFDDLIETQPDTALVIARRITELYPDNPAGWASRLGFERAMLGPQREGADLPDYLARFKTLDRDLRARGAVAPDVMAGMRMYAIQIGTDGRPELRAAVEYWTHRLAADPTGSDAAAMYRLNQPTRRMLADHDSSVALAGIDSTEAVWQHGDSLTHWVITFGLQFARHAQDSATTLRWLDRYSRRAPEEAAEWYDQLSHQRDLARPIADRLRRRIRWLGTRDDSLRPLDLSAREDADRRRQLQQSTLVSLGDLQLRLGDTTAALDTLARAVANGWDISVFNRVASVYSAMHDTTRAAQVFSLVINDPSTSEARADSITRGLSADVGAVHWHQLQAEGRSQMVQRVMAGAVMGPSRRDVHVVDDAGTTVTLASVARQRPAVVVFWSQYCGFSRVQLAQYAELKRELEAHGAAFIPIATDAQAPEARQLFDQFHVDWHSFFDTKGEARVAFRNLSTPEFYVLDERGRVRFMNHSPTLSLVEAVALVEPQ